MDDWVEQIERVEKNDPECTEIYIGYRSEFSSDILKPFVKAISKNTHLTSIELPGNEIADEAGKELLQAIVSNKKFKLTKLDLGFNKLTNKVADLLSEINSNHPNISIFLFGTEVDALTKPIRSTLPGTGSSSRDTPSSDDGKSKTVRDKKERKHRDKKDKSDRKISSSKSSDKKKSKKKSAEGSAPASMYDSRRKMLEARIAELQTMMEEEYKPQVEELEQRVKELSKGQSTAFITSIFAPRKYRKKHVTLSTKSIIITQKIAAGGGSSAEIFSCIVDGWLCVMKELDTSEMNQQTIDNFSREIRLLELLPPHENIVRYLFHDLKDDKLRLFMTHYNTSLGSYIRQQAADQRLIAVKTINRILLDIIKGIEYLHSQGIIHRDLKSDNIFVLYGERKEVKNCAIGDFDTAKRVGFKESAKTVLGTPSWMAPEVMNAHQLGSYSFPCDVYSFGMIVYELITLKMPYEGKNPMLVPKMVLDGEKPELPSLPRDYNTLAKLFDSCIAFNPESRPSIQKIKSTIALSLADC